jgi:SAM-dependent methyltransferase
MLLGPLEDQHIAPASLDAVVLMDVLEHLPDAFETIGKCCELLRSDGVLLIQTPCFPENKTLDQLKEDSDPFLAMLIDEHLQLFSRRSIQTFLKLQSIKSIVFEPACFAQYDMFIIASKSATMFHTSDDVASALSVGSGSRLVQALVDLDDIRRAALEKVAYCEADRAARLEVIEKQAREYADKIAEIEADRAARLEVIEKQAREYADKIAELEAERVAQDEVIKQLTAEITKRKRSLPERLSLAMRRTLRRRKSSR